MKSFNAVAVIMNGSPGHFSKDLQEAITNSDPDYKVCSVTHQTCYVPNEGIQYSAIVVFELKEK
jgi:hypothetical protein